MNPNATSQFAARSGGRAASLTPGMLSALLQGFLIPVGALIALSLPFAVYVTVWTLSR